MFALVLNAVAAGALVGSTFADRARSGVALRRAAEAFARVLPGLVVVTLLASSALAVLGPEGVSRLVGQRSGPRGMLAAAAIGSLTLLPGFVAFPLAAALLRDGAGVPQVILFVSTSTMVSPLTLAEEARTFGGRVALTRNALALALSVASAAVLGAVLA